jgi:hypothetical protein
MAPPLESVTVPVIDPLAACEKAATGIASKQNVKARTFIYLLENFG